MPRQTKNVKLRQAQIALFDATKTLAGHTPGEQHFAHAAFLSHFWNTPYEAEAKDISTSLSDAAEKLQELQSLIMEDATKIGERKSKNEKQT